VRAGFGLGVLVGALVGGGGVYLATERPWGSSQTSIEPDAGVAEVSKKKKKKRRGKKRRGKRRAGSGAAMADDIPVLTEAEQKLVWKGAKVAIPEKSVDFGSAEGGGRSLSATEINSAIKSGSQSVIDCIDEARGSAVLKSAVTFKLLVDGHGTVTKSRVRAPVYLFDHGFLKCARSAVRSVQFPATGAFTVVTAPYDLY